MKKFVPNQYHHDPFWVARRDHAYRLRVEDKLSYGAIAKRLGVTPERIRQMVATRARKLRWGTVEDRL